MRTETGGAEDRSLRDGVSEHGIYASPMGSMIFENGLIWFPSFANKSFERFFPYGFMWLHYFHTFDIGAQLGQLSAWRPQLTPGIKHVVRRLCLVSKEPSRCAVFHGISMNCWTNSTDRCGGDGSLL